MNRLGLLFVLAGLIQSTAAQCTGPNCQTCAGEICLQCDDHYTQNKAQTTCCSDECLQDIDGWPLCGVDGVCTYADCNDGYIGPECKRCTTVIDNCNICHEYNQTRDIHCTICATNYHITPDNQQCCSEGCNDCTSSPEGDNCLTCQQGWYKYNNICDRCGENCVVPSDGSARCDPTSGRCYLGCMDGWHGMRCNVSCDISRCYECAKHILSSVIGPPQIPTEVSIVQTQSNYVTVSWVPGFHGCFNQTFVIEYSPDGQTWRQENMLEIQGGLTLRRVNGTVSNLQSGTLYFMRLMSRNEKGNSNYTRVFNVTTEFSQVPDVVTKNMLLPAVVGGLAAVIAIAVVVIVVLSIRLHSRKHAGDQPDSGNDVHLNADRPVYDVLRYDGNPHAYSVLGHVGNYEDLTHDTSSVQPYSNLNNADGSHPAARFSSSSYIK